MPAHVMSTKITVCGFHGNLLWESYILLYLKGMQTKCYPWGLHFFGMLHSVCSSCLSTFRENLFVLFSWVKQSWIAWHPERATASNTSGLKTETPNFYSAFHIYCPILVKWGIACCTQCGHTVVCFVKIEPGKIVLYLWTYVKVHVRV